MNTKDKKRGTALNQQIPRAFSVRKGTNTFRMPRAPHDYKGLKQALEDNNIQIKAFADAVGVTDKKMYHILSDGRSLPFEWVPVLMQMLDWSFADAQFFILGIPYEKQAANSAGGEPRLTFSEWLNLYMESVQTTMRETLAQ